MLLVTDYDSFNQAMEFINGATLLSYDTETTGLNPRKDKVIGFGVSNGTDGFYLPLLRWCTVSRKLTPTPALDNNLHKPLLQALATKSLLMFNASFDARFTIYNLGVDLLPALHTDVLLLKHTCDEEFPFGLKEIATKLWSTDVKKEKEAMQASIKANGGKPTEFFKADTNLVAEYCVQDCNLTFRLYNYYRDKLKRDKLHDFFYTQEVMPLYKQVTIPMEQIGVKMDVPKMKLALKSISTDIKTLEDEIVSSIEPLLHEWTLAYLDKEYPLVTAKGNKTKLGKSMEEYGLTSKWALQHRAWSDDNPGLTTPFNLDSKPNLKFLFFNIMDEVPIGRTPTGLPQLDDEFIQTMHSKHPWTCSLTDYNRLQKIKSTYIERFLDEVEGDIFYPRFQQHRTVSGRYSSDLQQLPRPMKGNSLVAKYTSLIRQFVISRPGRKLVSADYVSLEPVIFAHVSGDRALIDIFNSGKDFYSEIAIRTENIKGVSSVKTDANYLGTLMPERRQKAKVYALGLCYGMTAYKLKFELNCSPEEAERLVSAYWNAFPELKRWVNETHTKVQYDGYIRTQSGRVRHLPEVAHLFAKYGASIQCDLQLWQAFNKTSAFYEQAKIDRKRFKNEMNNAVNVQIQGLAASIVNRAMISLAKQFSDMRLDVSLVGNVHDEIIAECSEERLDVVKVIMRNTMQNIVQLSVPLLTEPKSGGNYAQCK